MTIKQAFRGDLVEEGEHLTQIQNLQPVWRCIRNA
jgi:hypothetical protein